MTAPIRIGQIVPSSNTTMETEIPAMLREREAIRPERFTFHSSRMRMKKVTEEEFAAMDGRRWHVDSLESIFYASGWFIASQVLLLGALYVFARVDWKALFDQHKFAWLHK